MVKYFEIEEIVKPVTADDLSFLAAALVDDNTEIINEALKIVHQLKRERTGK